MGNFRVTGLSVVVALAAMASVARPAGADDLAGTISCSVAGESFDRAGFIVDGLRFRPFVGSAPRKVVASISNNSSSCDSSGVTGTDVPITEVQFKFYGTMVDAMCPTFLTSPQIKNGRARMLWRGASAAGMTTIAAGRVTLTDVSYVEASHTLTLTMTAGDRGPFPKETVTLNLGLDGLDGDGAAAQWFAACSDVSFLTSLTFGHTNPSTLEVQ